MWPAIIWAVIIFGGAVVKWAAKRAQEQKSIKDRQEMSTTARDESMRTGRPEHSFAPPEQPAAAPLDPQARLRELAMQRQEQLRKLRERGQASGGTSMAAPAPATQSRPAPSGQLWPGGPVVNQRTPSPSRNAAPRPVAMPMSPPAPTPRDREKQRQRSAEARKRQQQEAIVRASQVESQRVKMSSDQSRRTAAARIAGLGATEERFESDPTAREARWPTRRDNLQPSSWTPDRLREAFILTEVMGPPVSMRD